MDEAREMNSHQTTTIITNNQNIRQERYPDRKLRGRLKIVIGQDARLLLLHDEVVEVLIEQIETEKLVLDFLVVFQRQGQGVGRIDRKRRNLLVVEKLRDVAVFVFRTCAGAEKIAGRRI